MFNPLKMIRVQVKARPKAIAEHVACVDSLLQILMSDMDLRKPSEAFESSEAHVPWNFGLLVV